MLVHDLYRFVALPKYSFQARARSALISLLPSHGHHVHHLEASAPAESRPYEPDDAQVSNLLVSLSRCASQFTQLRSLQLHLYTVDRTLSTEQQADLVDMFKVLPPQMQELDLAGFLWTGAAKALAAAQQPILQRLSLNLESIPGAWMAPRVLARWFEYTVQSRQAFPALKELEAGQLYTQADGEDFDEWDPEGDIISEGGDVWQPEVRRKLEQDCEMLDIDAAFDWIWFEGFG
ncbi:hypothetical protein CPB85DRAFT_1443493 [Mucidula mucida]|nr:hypothetical protein CPB85DRAFT_1443493 [Mucidula mucida]